jgi:hypothetical protein
MDAKRFRSNTISLNQQYHQIEWMMSATSGPVLHPNDVTDRVMFQLRSVDSCVALSALKEYEAGRLRNHQMPPLDLVLSEKIRGSAPMSGVWLGLLPGKNFGFIQTFDRRRIWCHERQVRNEEITPESRYASALVIYSRAFRTQ